MVKMLVCGMVTDKSVYTTDAGKAYYTLYVVAGRKVMQISVPQKIYNENQVNDTVSLECDFFVNYDKKFTSIYIKE